MRASRFEAGPGAVRAAVLVAALVATAAAVPAGPPEDGAAALAELQSWLDDTRTLEARFEQELVSGALGAGLVERGRVIIARPGRMRWDYLEPERKVALIDGDETGLWVEEDRQYLSGRLEEGGGLLPALLAGASPLVELFEPELVATPEVESGWLLRLRPRDDDDTFSVVILRLRDRDSAVQAAEVVDAAGNRMIYRFGSLRRNRPLSDGAFDFVPPPGTEILGR